MSMVKRILITGATSGIGRATALLLASKGHQIGCLGRNKTKLNELSRIGSIYPCDVVDPSQVSAAFQSFVQEFGGIDVVINNAGSGVFNPLVDATLAEWHDMIDVNVKGVLTVLHASLPHLIKSRGQLIQMGSLGSHHVFPNSGVYCASKHALWAISESIRLELSDKISVTTISPGPVNTDFIAASTNPNMVDTYADYFAHGLKPESVADQIAYAIEQNGSMTISEIILRPKRIEK
jgi:NADP-dependent 3-hydroxy acid dehydrogenase YdfG